MREVGRWVREERAGEARPPWEVYALCDEREESVRCLSFSFSCNFWEDGTGSVAVERVEETEVRRGDGGRYRCDEFGESWSELEGEVEGVLVVLAVTVNGARGTGLGGLQT